MRGCMMGWDGKQAWDICAKLEMMVIRFDELVCTYHFSILGWVERRRTPKHKGQTFSNDVILLGIHSTRHGRSSPEITASALIGRSCWHNHSGGRQERLEGSRNSVGSHAFQQDVNTAIKEAATGLRQRDPRYHVHILQTRTSLKNCRI